MRGWSVSVTVRPGASGATLAADSAEDGIAKGREHAALLLGNDESRERIKIVVSFGCEKCGATGRVLRKRTRMTYDDCTACKGSGASRVEHRETVTRDELSKKEGRSWDSVAD